MVLIDPRKLIVTTQNIGGYLAGRCIMCGASGYTHKIEHEFGCEVAIKLGQKMKGETCQNPSSASTSTE